MDFITLGSLLFMISAFGLGALHALEPGHGKSVMAAFVIGTNAKLKDAILLGLTVVFSHMSVVILFGIVSIFLLGALDVNATHDVMGLIDGVILIIVGLWIIRKFYHHHEHSIHTKKRCNCNWVIYGINPLPCSACCAPFQHFKQSDIQWPFLCFSV